MENDFALDIESDENHTCPSDDECSCYSCSSYESIPDWDNDVMPNGELFYVKLAPLSKPPHSKESPQKPTNKFRSLVLKRKSHAECKSNGVLAHEFTVQKISLSNACFGIVCLDVAHLQSTSINIDEQTLYCFPKTSETESNIVNSMKGAFLTLYHVLPKLVSKKLESSSFFVRDERFHLTFVEEDNILLLLALPETMCSLFALKELGLSLNRYMKFRYGSFRRCFMNIDNIDGLNTFFYNLFSLPLRWLPINDLSLPLFESTLPQPCILSLSYEIEIRIHEEISEILSNDFGDMSEDHYGCLRSFMMIGACLYHKGFLVCSELDRDDMSDIHSFLQLNDLLNLSKHCSIDSLVVFKEVFLSSCLKYTHSAKYHPLDKRWIILIVGQGHTMLVVLLQASDTTAKLNEPLKPDVLYVEQLQDSLDRILTNEVSEAFNESLLQYYSSGSPMRIVKKSSEDLSPAVDSLNGSFETDTTSDSMSRTTGSYNEETGPVIGRRAQRMKNFRNAGSVCSLPHVNYSDSEHSEFETTGSSHSSLFTENSTLLGKDLLTNKRIITGPEKTLFYFVDIDSDKGVILCPLRNSDNNPHIGSVLNNFRLTAQKIHSSVFSKKDDSRMLVKEHGSLFEYKSNVEDGKKSGSIIYWVIGRLLLKPHLREIYVCYEDGVSQNMVEIAFRLSF